MLELLLDPNEARVDLILEIFDGLIGVSGEQPALVLLFRLHDQQVLIAERVFAHLELEFRSLFIHESSILNECQGALRGLEIFLFLWCRDVGEAIESQLSHHLVLALSLDSHVCIVVAFDHRDGDVEHDVGKEHRRGDESCPQTR